MRSDQVAAIKSQHTGHEAGVVLLKKKKLLYKQQDGCCEMCGRHFGTEALEIHHLIGVRENPGLALATSNLVLLCHECHVEVHRKTVPRGEN